MAKVEVKLEGVDEVEKPKLVMRVPQLKLDLLTLGRLTEDKPTLRIQRMVQKQEMSYLMLDTSGLGFGLVIWG